MNHQVLADDILNYMNFHGIEKANLLRHSLGGKAVMTFAISYPEKVEKLIVADIAPKAYPPSSGNYQSASIGKFRWGKIKTRRGKRFGSVHSRKICDSVLTKNLYWTEDKKLNWRFNINTLAEKYNDFVANAIKLENSEGETLFLAGAKSQLYPSARWIIDA